MVPNILAKKLSHIVEVGLFKMEHSVPSRAAGSGGLRAWTSSAAAHLFRRELVSYLGRDLRRAASASAFALFRRSVVA